MPGTYEIVWIFACGHMRTTYFSLDEIEYLTIGCGQAQCPGAKS